MSNLKLLYTTCHPWLERSDYQIFKSLGFDVFSSGFFKNPAMPSSNYVKPLQYEVNSDLLGEFNMSNGSYIYTGKSKLMFTRSFISKFDVIVVTWRYDYLLSILPLISNNQVVLFQTVGQSSSSRELQLRGVKSPQVKIIRMSEGERNFPNYAGASAIIDLAVEVDRFRPWIGSEDYILSVNKMMWRSKECNVSNYLKATKGFSRKLYGTDNESFRYDFSLGPISPEKLLDCYSKARLCFCLGTKPCPVVMGFKEAMASGCPVVTWGPRLGSCASRTYTAHAFIQNGKNGFYSDDIRELRGYIRKLMEDLDLAKRISKQAIKTAKEYFDITVITDKWKEFFTKEITY